MRISARADYALRAAAELAAAGGGPVKGDQLATSQKIPHKFLENILADLRHARLVRSQRGADGGYWLAPPAEDISLADVIRAVEGPLASVRGEAPEDVEYPGAAEHLQDIWIAVRASVRSVVEHVTLADLASGNLPPEIKRLGEDPEAWVRRGPSRSRAAAATRSSRPRAPAPRPPRASAARRSPRRHGARAPRAPRSRGAPRAGP